MPTHSPTWCPWQLASASSRDHGVTVDQKVAWTRDLAHPSTEAIISDPVPMSLLPDIDAARRSQNGFVTISATIKSATAVVSMPIMLVRRAAAV